jgi:trk system potassium uptake protein TrkH
MFRNGGQYLGLSFLILSVANVLTTLCAVLYNEQDAALFFVAMAILFLLSGLFLRRVKSTKPLTQQLTVSFLTLIFLIAIPLGALPYIFLERTSGIDALFESTSGFTTCGMTVFLDVESFNKSVLFWRSMTEWLGGMGLITLFLVLLRGRALEAFAEAKGLKRAVGVPLSTLMKQMFRFYLTVTGLGFLSLLFLGGLTPFDALNHAMTAISTGGFSTKNLGVFYFEQSTAFNQTAISLTLTSMSLLGMTSFVLLTGYLFRRKIKTILSATYRLDLDELKVMGPTILIGTFLLMIPFVTRLGLPVFTALRQAVFHIVTSLSGTGYNGMDLSQWTIGEKLTILIISIMGGSAWSGAGALKLTRIYSFLTMIPKIPKYLFQRAKITIDEKTKEDLTYIAIFLVILLIGVFILYPFLSHHSFMDILYQVEGALGNTGPQILDVSQIHLLGKTIFIILMLLGYFEVLPLLTLIRFLKTSMKSNKT